MGLAPVVYASLFICGGVYPASLPAAWQVRLSRDLGEKLAVVLIVAGVCRVEGAFHVYRVPTLQYYGQAKRYAYMRAKFELWNLPYDRVVYYDLDIRVKPPVGRCASLCSSSFCAVRDPVATWPFKTHRYFNAGFMVLAPSKAVYADLMRTRPSPGKFAEQDTLNRYFSGKWQKLPRECNWLHSHENRPLALTDAGVFAVHG